MRAIQLVQPGEFRHIDIAPPTAPGPGEVLLKTHCVGICGTDLGGYLGKMPFFTYPKIIGHELGVEVLEVGADVHHLRVGDRCCVEPYINCGHCYACRRGHTNCCQTNQTLGVMIDGGLCDQFVLRADKVHAANALGYDQLALVETLAIGCHAANRGDCHGDDIALVIGAGPIGLSVIEFARLTGARIIVMDRVASRLEFVRQTYGINDLIVHESAEQAEAIIKEWTHGDRCRVVIDATGNSHSMQEALRFVAQTGTLVYVGISSQPVSFPHPLMHKPEMTLKASRNALPADFIRITRLIEHGVIDTNPWITHRASFNNMIEAFPTFTQPESGVIKAVVEVA